MSIKGKTTIVPCGDCGENEVEVSLYAKKENVRCPDCGGGTGGSKKSDKDAINAKRYKKEVPLKLTAQQQAIREAVKAELDEYSMWEWLDVKNKDISGKKLNELAKKGWRFAFQIHDGTGIMMHKPKVVKHDISELL